MMTFIDFVLVSSAYLASLLFLGGLVSPAIGRLVYGRYTPARFSRKVHRWLAYLRGISGTVGTALGASIVWLELDRSVGHLTGSETVLSVLGLSLLSWIGLSVILSRAT